MAFDVFDDDDGVVDHQADGEHDGQQGQQVDGEAENLHQKDRSDQRQRDRHHRDEDRAQRAEEQENDDDDDQQGVAEGLEDLADGIVDIFGGVVGDPRLHAGRQILLDPLHFGPHPGDDVEGVGVGQRPDADEDGRLAGEVDLGVVVLGAEGDIGDVAEADDGAVLLPGPPAA